VSLRQFVSEVNTLLAMDDEESSFLPKVGAAMRALVARDDWLDPAFAQPDFQFYRQYLLYVDPDDRFSVVSFVWGPGQHTPIHDHTVWGVIGMLRGAELTQSYEVAADGTPRASGEELMLEPGSVAFVSPAIGDVHKVRNACNDRVSISIHAYGADIGKVRRHVFAPEGGEPQEFVSGYANAEP
jgi:predicted metal-dependent enzyme (double-stranded beta helix superfamily)